MRREVAHELDRVATRIGQLLHTLERGAGIVLGKRVRRAEDEVGIGDIEHLEHILERDLAVSVGDELVERPDRVTEAAARGARDHLERTLVGLDPLGLGDPLQDGRDLRQRRPAEVEPVTAVDDRRQDLVGLGRREHEDRVRRRLLEGLEKRVPGRGRKHVRLVQDVDLPAPHRGREADLLAEVADVVDRVVRGGVHLDHVSEVPAAIVVHDLHSPQGLRSARSRS